ncbi:hypothetical protein [cf. Phormidesmis sp. LEGE 11477]|uniref:hypothetical protein n=1 Tax=cf. Phormidesmis sp. LEGE 11477 TaxID=1828680 RepID=UPI00187E881F|nr:hypothetical protein [cf. Phormidesmis sp. LEGE 11477]MBE9063620.1 hypothetical protein [cf. Phormidesmis sp. LEGE 11477]
MTWNSPNRLTEQASRTTRAELITLILKSGIDLLNAVYQPNEWIPVGSGQRVRNRISTLEEPAVAM